MDTVAGQNADEANEFRPVAGKESAGNAPLKWLEELEPEVVARMLSRERPQSAALVVSNLSTKTAADVLLYLDEKMRSRVAVLLSNMQPVSKEVIEAADKALRKGAPELAARECRQFSSGHLLEGLGGAAESVLESARVALLRGNDPRNGSAKQPFFTPEDLTSLTDSQIKKVLAETMLNDLGLVLRVGSDALRVAVFNNVSPDARHAIQQQLAGTAQVKVSIIEDAQGRIVDAMHRLAVKGGVN